MMPCYLHIKALTKIIAKLATRDSARSLSSGGHKLLPRLTIVMSYNSFTFEKWITANVFIQMKLHFWRSGSPLALETGVFIHSQGFFSSVHALIQMFLSPVQGHTPLSRSITICLCIFTLKNRRFDVFLIASQMVALISCSCGNYTHQLETLGKE